MIIADLSEIDGRTYPARRRTQNLVGGASPIQAASFSMGYVTLEPNGGQVPWHNQEQEEIYFIVEGAGEMCLGEERAAVRAGSAVYIPHRVFHQLTNTGAAPMRMIYCYVRRATWPTGARNWTARCRARGGSAAAARRSVAAVDGEAGPPTPSVSS